MEAVDDSLQALSVALLGFARAPGRFALRQREPALLFEQLDTLALWALGRVPDYMGQAQAALVQESALLFVQRACFAPGLTHYQVLGLHPRECNPAVLRARYRALIRLTHPDMGATGLPADAAGMVNRAHEVLCSDERRQAYDRQLAMQLPASTTATHDTNRQPTGASLQSPMDSWTTTADAAAQTLAHDAPGWHVRWLQWQASHPRALPLAIGALAFLAGAAVLLGWSAHDSAADRRLVVAGTQPGLSTPLPPETEPRIRLRVPIEWEKGIQTPVSTLPERQSPPTAEPPVPAHAERAAANPAPTSGKAGSADLTTRGSLQPGADTSEAAAPGWLAQAVAAFKTLTPPATVPADAMVQPAVTASVTPASTAAASARAQARTESVLTPTPGKPAAGPGSSPAQNQQSPQSPPNAQKPPTASTSGKSATAAPAAPATTAATAAAASAAPATPSPAPAMSAAANPGVIWDVDSVRARHYLVELLNMLEEPAQALKTSRYLAGMNVRGSLLHTALRDGTPVQQLRVERVHLNESSQPGVLRLRGLLQAQVQLAGAPERPVQWRVAVEFRGTPDGTVLTLLDLKESE